MVVFRHIVQIRPEFSPIADGDPYRRTAPFFIDLGFLQQGFQPGLGFPVSLGKGPVFRQAGMLGQDQRIIEDRHSRIGGFKFPEAWKRFFFQGLGKSLGTVEQIRVHNISKGDHHGRLAYRADLCVGQIFICFIHVVTPLTQSVSGRSWLPYRS